MRDRREPVGSGPSRIDADAEALFAEALKRIEAGESAEDVLISAPEAIRPTLRDLLKTAGILLELSDEPIPGQSPEALARDRVAFLEAASAMREDDSVKDDSVENDSIENDGVEAIREPGPCTGRRQID